MDNPKEPDVSDKLDEVVVTVEEEINGLESSDNDVKSSDMIEELKSETEQIDFFVEQNKELIEKLKVNNNLLKDKENEIEILEKKIDKLEVKDVLFKGISCYVTSKNENIVLQNIKNLRENLQCSLPIELWLKKNTITENFFIQINNYNCMLNVLENFISEDNIKDLNDEAIKNYLYNYTSFQQVILIDDSILFASNPEYLFDDDLYQERGIMFLPFLKYHNFNKDKGYCDFVSSLVSDSYYFPDEQTYVLIKKTKMVKN